MGKSYRKKKPDSIAPPETPIVEAKEKKKEKKAFVMPPKDRDRQLLNKTTGMIQKNSEQLIMPKALISPEIRQDVILTTKFEARKNNEREIRIN